MEARKLVFGEDGKRICPECGGALDFIEGSPVKIIDGKLNMEDTEDHYSCTKCRLVFRPLVHTEYYIASDLPKKKHKKLHKTASVGDLQPMQLKRDDKGKCACPRCKAQMRFVEGEPVRIIDGKLNMQDVLDHFICDECSSVYRRIAGTDYFQWHEE